MNVTLASGPAAAPIEAMSLTASDAAPDADRAPILIAGPTASGKSRLALALAERFGGVVVNADALQVYDGWRVLTARPSDDDMARAEHRLFGHVDWTSDAYSVGRWLEEVRAVLADAEAAAKRVVVVGGTGLYFRALTKGLAPIPPTPPETRAEVDALISDHGVDAAAARLAADDPQTAARVDPKNPRRVARALEVLIATGRGLASWAEETSAPIVTPDLAVRLFLAPERAWLRERIASRLSQMADDGALDEVRIALAHGLSTELPAMKALGAAEFAAHLTGGLTLDAAIAAATTATAQFAKRQETWARGQMKDWRRISPEHAARLVDDPTIALDANG